jgi:fructosamine-3-kinase
VTIPENCRDRLPDIAERLVGGPIHSITPVRGGRNSRVYHVRSAGNDFALKQYPSQAEDPRDRLGAELRALALMAGRGIDTVPRAVAADVEQGFALLTWLNGEPPGAIDTADIDQAAGFLAQIHALRGDSGAAQVGPASEACLSGQEIQRQIEQRLDRLYQASVGDNPLRRFLDGPFAAAAERLFGRARTLLDFDATLAPDRRSLVPADFGFHNSLRRPDGALVFFDFEYFGWDDPVKLTADVMLHPGTSVAAPLIRRFRHAAETLYGTDRGFRPRLAAFHPLFGLRWVLILLNEFLPERWLRRVAAGAEESWDAAKERQLALACGLLTSLAEGPNGSGDGR